MFQVDRLYGTLGPEFFQYLMDALTHDLYAVNAQRVLKMDVLMRICYLLSEKPYACKFSFFFDQAIEHILREFYVSRCQFRSMNLRKEENKKTDYYNGFPSVFCLNPLELTKIVLQNLKIVKCTIWPSTLYPNFLTLYPK